MLLNLMRIMSLLSVSIVIAAGCATTSGGDQRATASRALEVYTKQNIHVVDVPGRGGEVTSKASYANWVDPVSGHWMIPVNTKVRIEQRKGGVIRGYVITVIESGKVVHFECNAGNTGLADGAYMAQITAAEPISFSALNSKDRDGIRDGKAYPGMSKEGVRIALGLPAKHRTPSMENNTWIYWKDRYRTMRVDFENDKVVSVQ